MDVHDTLSESVADAIRARLAHRRRRGEAPSSARELAAIIDISQSAMSARLTGATPIDLNELEKIAAALEVEVGTLLPGSTRDGQERQIRYSDAPAARLSAAVRHPVDPRPIRTRGTASGRGRSARAAWTHAEVTA